MLLQLGAKQESEDDVVGLLLGCHRRIRHFCGVARTLGLRADLPDAEVQSACDAVLRYFTLALPLHVEDEEQSIVPRLLAHAPALAPTLQQMESQHARQEPLVEELVRAVIALRTSPQDALARTSVARAAEALSRDFAEHLVMEEALLFPAIRRELSEAEQQEIRQEQRERRRADPSGV